MKFCVSNVFSRNNKGLVPRVCEELFNKIRNENERKENETLYTVKVSMLEIYMEKVRDLLDSKSVKKNKFLDVKGDGKKGFYAVGAIKVRLEHFYNFNLE